MSFSGKVVMVTGAGGGIGRGVAKAFCDEGASVFVTDLNETTARETERQLKESGGKCVAQKVDVRSRTEVFGCVEGCLKTFGKVDVLVNCAGILSLVPYDEITQEEWDNTMAVNARGTLFMCQAVGREMVRRGAGGKIVNISSVAGKIGGMLYTHYCASKFAVIGMTKCLALELAGHGINVNAVCPGDVETEMTEYEFRTLAKIRGVSIDEIRRQTAKKAPLGRLCQPSEVAGIVLFLASEKADYMTGQSINVTGGAMTF
jgi:NAD(P)-dependent dehydrogenase (short-subunit alcohol dehydrogenase family)